MALIENNAKVAAEIALNLSEGSWTSCVGSAPARSIISKRKPVSEGEKIKLFSKRNSTLDVAILFIYVPYQGISY